ncbi:putative T7SS-secreted protein [Microbacterium sp. NPDC087665]|uniref:putative T7SS-secreted protein n=1 Tax=Microbacterium sp. NPDC087665 TaxID=3364194 RepID=UPI00382DA553
MAMVTAHSRVEDLVPGDLSAIASARDMLGSGIAPVQGAAATLTGLQVQGWKGVAADRFALVAPREAQKVSVLPGAFSRSASAMSRWESAFIAARAQAAEAVRLAARADALTAQSRSDYQTAVASAQAASVPVTSPTQPVTFVDRGATFNAQAQATLATALSSLKAVESEVASAIRPTADLPRVDPKDREGWEQVVMFLPDVVFPGVIGGIVDLAVGLAESGWWIFETFDPFRFIVDQINGGDGAYGAWIENMKRRFGEVGDTIGYMVTHPGDVIGAILADFFAVDLWANEPGVAFGRVALNAALLVTGVGGFLKGVKGVTITAKAAQAARLEKLELERIAKLARLETRATQQLDGSKGVRVDNGKIVVDGKPAMTVAEWTEKYDVSTHNMNAERATLGAYRSGDPTSYEKLAAESGDSYFGMPSSKTTDMWNDTRDAYGLTDAQMYELFNRPFLDEIIDKGLPIRFNEDPDHAKGLSLIKEWAYLQEKGYVLDPITNVATKED